MKVELDSGRKLVLKELTVDERDEMLDSVQYESLDDGSVKIKMLHTTMTKFIRTGVESSNDDFIKSLTFSEKSEIFRIIQEDIMNLGEEEASD